MVDPLFQRVLVKECRSQKIPVIFDEVFTGFWRLGAEVCLLNHFAVLARLLDVSFLWLRNFILYLLLFQSATEFIFCKPDIACYAKLMTGGIVPLAVTLASEAVFEAFVGDSKVYPSVFTICMSSISFCSNRLVKYLLFMSKNHQWLSPIKVLKYN